MKEKQSKKRESRKEGGEEGEMGRRINMHGTKLREVFCRTRSPPRHSCRRNGSARGRRARLVPATGNALPGSR